MQTILVVGEGECARQVAEEVGASGYAVELSPELKDARDAAAVVVCLESPDQSLELPDKGERPPVIAVVPEASLDGRTWALAVEDLILYPLRPHEMETRLGRLLGPKAPAELADVFRQGALAIDTAGYRVYVAGALVELTFKEYELLRFLATHAGRAYSREALLDKVWGYDYFGGARTVDVHIRRIRSKIERGGLTFIETVRSVGYRFHASS